MDGVDWTDGWKGRIEWKGQMSGRNGWGGKGTDGWKE